MGLSGYKSLLKFGKEVEAAYPATLCRFFTSAFLQNTEHPLATNTGIILEAAKREDVEFFISLGKILAQRKANTLLTIDPKGADPSSQEQIAFFWINGLLWLMTDTAGLEFFDLVLGINISLSNYKKAKKRLHLIKHPSVPIVEVRIATGSMIDTSEASLSSARQECTLVMRRGWIISKGKLLKLSR